MASFSMPSIMFVGKVRSLLNSGARERYLTQVGSGLTHIQ
jgi:hypothetical protein